MVIVTGFRVQDPKLSRKSSYCDRFLGSELKTVKKRVVIVTGIRVQGPKLSRKCGYCDRFQCVGLSPYNCVNRK